jgi:hypothetical protein
VSHSWPATAAGKFGVARWPLTGSRAGPMFEDEASPATRFRRSCVGELRREGRE